MAETLAGMDDGPVFVSLSTVGIVSNVKAVLNLLHGGPDEFQRQLGYKMRRFRLGQVEAAGAASWEWSDDEGGSLSTVESSVSISSVSIMSSIASPSDRRSLMS